MMTTSILCAIDFSESSLKGLRWAIGRASELKIHLTILYSFRLTRPQNGESILSVKKKLHEEAERKFRVIEKDLLANTSISYDFKIEVGFIADRIENHTKDHDTRFLVIDKQLRSQNEESFDQILENSLVPIVIIP